MPAEAWVACRTPGRRRGLWSLRAGVAPWRGLASSSCDEAPCGLFSASPTADPVEGGLEQLRIKAFKENSGMRSFRMRSYWLQGRGLAGPLALGSFHEGAFVTELDTECGISPCGWGAWPILRSWDEVKGAFLKTGVLCLSPPTPPLPTRACTHAYPHAKSAHTLMLKKKRLTASPGTCSILNPPGRTATGAEGSACRPPTLRPPDVKS